MTSSLAEQEVRAYLHRLGLNHLSSTQAFVSGNPLIVVYPQSRIDNPPCTDRPAANIALVENPLLLRIRETHISARGKMHFTGDVHYIAALEQSDSFIISGSQTYNVEKKGFVQLSHLYPVQPVLRELLVPFSTTKM